MTVLEFLVLLLVAGVAGALGQAIAGRRSGGFLVSIALGFIGALVGRWLAGLLDLPPMFVLNVGGNDFPIVWSILGAAVFVVVLSLFTRGDGKR